LRKNKPLRDITRNQPFGFQKRKIVKWPSDTLRDIGAISAILTSLSLFGAWLLARFYFQPKLDLVGRFVPGIFGEPQAGRISLLLNNTGRLAACPATIELRIYKPQNIAVNYGLFLNNKIGLWEPLNIPSVWDIEKSLKPQVYVCHLEHDVSVKPKHPPLQIAYFNFDTSEKTAPNDLDYEIAWTMYGAGKITRTGQVKFDGSYLKQILRNNLQQSPRANGYSIPIDKIPDSPED